MMKASDAVTLIRLIRDHRKWDEQGEAFLVDADELEDAILASVARGDLE